VNDGGHLGVRGLVRKSVGACAVGG
jgi:hypothetical protein